MTEPDDLARLLELVQGALGRPLDERDSYLETACGGDERLLARARKLLAEELPSDFVEPPEPGTERAFGGGLAGTELGDFRLVEEVDRGGMGVVYRARQAGLERDVAVKILPSIRRADPVQGERFQREILAASRVRHPALLEVIATGEDDELAWYAMPYVEGHDLHAELAAQAIARRDECALPLFGSAEYVRKVTEQIAHLAEGLQRAHDAGVIHRDIKPRNILLDGSGAMFLTDFGLARLSDSETLTATQAIQGTPHYMSPEQARALRDPITHRTDIYSLSVVLYELLTQRRPFQGADVRDLLKRIGSGTHDHVRRVNTSLHRDLATICEKGMSHYPSDRYGSAGELAEDLRRYLRSEAVLARPLPVVRRVWRRVRRHPVKLAVGAAVVVGGVAAWGSAVSARRSAEREALRRPLTALVGAGSPGQGLLADAYTVLQLPDLHEKLGRSNSELVGRATEIVSDDIARRVAAIEDMTLLGAGPRTDDRYGPDVELETDPLRLLDALLMATRGAGIYPGHERLGELAKVERMFPRLSLEVAAPLAKRGPARVSYQMVDHVTASLSEPRELGVTPLTAVPLPPGSYRFTAVTEDGGLSEVERDLPFQPDDLRITFWPRTDAEIATRMVLIEPEGSRFPSKADRTYHCHTPNEGPLLRAFRIGKYEMSNGDLEQFLKATGAEPPAKWVDFGLADGEKDDPGELPEDFDIERWRRLPAVGVRYSLLRSCAEWMGCRVPTHHESEYVLRGPELLDLPASCEPSMPVGSWPFNVEIRAARRPVDANERLIEAYRALAPVDSQGAFDPLFGIHHGFGNASEYTSSRALERLGAPRATISAIPDEHVVLGCAWDARARGLDLSSHEAASTRASHVSFRSTIRVARSARTGP